MVNEDEETLTLCLTKDKITAQSIPLLLTAMESTPLSATGNASCTTFSQSTHMCSNSVCCCE